MINKLASNFFTKIRTGYLYSPGGDCEKGIIRWEIQRIFVFCLTARRSSSRCKMHALHICGCG